MVRIRRPRASRPSRSRAQVHLRIVEDEIAGAVRGVGTHQREVAGDRVFRYEVAVPKRGLLAFRQFGAEATGVKKAGCRAAYTDALGERPCGSISSSIRFLTQRRLEREASSRARAPPCR